MRQRLMRAPRASPSAFPRMVLLGLFFCPLTPRAPCRHASIRTLFAASAAGACWCSQFQGCCHLRDELQDSSYPVPLVLPRPRSHPNSALSHTPQNLNPFPNRSLMPPLSPCPPLPLSGCTADRTLPPSPTAYAAAPPASAPPPPLPSSSSSCSPSSHSPSWPQSAPLSFPKPSGRCPALRPAGYSALPAPTAAATTRPPPC